MAPDTPRHDELAFAVCPNANDRRELIGEYARKQRQIAGAIVPRAKPVADGRHGLWSWSRGCTCRREYGATEPDGKGGDQTALAA
jgi:hypothetical protein